MPPPTRSWGALALGAALIALSGPRASAQERRPSDRGPVLAQVRATSACVQREGLALQRIVSLIDASQSQRDQATDPALRRDAERAIETLLERAAEVQRSLARCVGSAPSGPAPSVVPQDPSADPAAEAMAEAVGSLQTVEADAVLARAVRVVRAEQVDGSGRMPLADVRAAVRSIGAQLQRCQESHLPRGARELDLVFTVRSAGRVSEVEVERTGAGDAALERCVRQAGRSLAVSRGASGGEAVFSYRLRFGG